MMAKNTKEASLKSVRSLMARQRAQIDRRTALMGIGAGALGAGAIALHVSGSSAREQALAQYGELMEQKKPLDAQIAQLDAYDQSLPNHRQAERLMDRAQEAGGEIATVQNTYLEQTGPVLAESAPEIDPRTAGQAQPHVYTPEERQAAAERLRVEAISSAQRAMRAQLDPVLTDGVDLDASGPWYEAAGLGTGTVALRGFVWSVSEVHDLDKAGMIDLVWTLRDEAGTDLAWVMGQFSNTKQMVTSLEMASTLGGAK